MKSIMRHAAIGFLVLGLAGFGSTGLGPPEDWDPSTQLWRHAQQPMPIRQVLYAQRNVIWPAGAVCLGLSAVLGWLGKEKE
ncbi:MAG: hypothetical protein JJU29_13245 [Verrucomicrobia bacterium]|nr:hypothetical protein [Verrucomicrobiota bacterium]MCH8510051.1 hypothetical protein [Kiritimatiellia bacterium]